MKNIEITCFYIKILNCEINHYKTKNITFARKIK